MSLDEVEFQDLFSEMLFLLRVARALEHGRVVVPDDSATVYAIEQRRDLRRIGLRARGIETVLGRRPLRRRADVFSPFGECRSFGRRKPQLAVEVLGDQLR